MTALLVLIVAAASLQTSAGQKPNPKMMSYESYCQMERAEKRKHFKGTTPEHRAQLARTHLERWREANRAQLNAQQLALLEDMIAAMVPATFDGGSPAERTEAAKVVESLETRADALFSRDQVRALRYDAPCAAK
jgi:hypothetical protein